LKTHPIVSALAIGSAFAVFAGLVSMRAAARLHADDAKSADQQHADISEKLRASEKAVVRLEEENWRLAAELARANQAVDQQRSAENKRVDATIDALRKFSARGRDGVALFRSAFMKGPHSIRDPFCLLDLELELSLDHDDAIMLHQELINRDLVESARTPRQKPEKPSIAVTISLPTHYRVVPHPKAGRVLEPTRVETTEDHEWWQKTSHAKEVMLRLEVIQ
jgi:hypothetical protein